MKDHNQHHNDNSFKQQLPFWIMFVIFVVLVILIIKSWGHCDEILKYPQIYKNRIEFTRVNPCTGEFDGGVTFDKEIYFQQYTKHLK